MNQDPAHDLGDYCLRRSLLSVADELSKPYYYSLMPILKMISVCRLDTVLFPIKNPAYRYGNSGSANPDENTLFNRPTFWLYQNVLRHFGINPPKPLNGDQMRAFFIWLYLTKDMAGSRVIGRKILLGFLLRLGFFPSLQEHILFKPQTCILLFKMFKLTMPLYLLTYPIFYLTMKAELRVPIEKSTTNKISLLPTMKVLGLKMPSKVYIDKVYDTYFTGPLQFIAAAMKGVL